MLYYSFLKYIQTSMMRRCTMNVHVVGIRLGIFGVLYSHSTPDAQGMINLYPKGPQVHHQFDPFTCSRGHF